MHALTWGKPTIIKSVLFRELLLDDEVICQINMDEYIDASIEDSLDSRNRMYNMELAIKEALNALSSKLYREVTIKEFRRCIYRGEIK